MSQVIWSVTWHWKSLTYYKTSIRWLIVQWTLRRHRVIVVQTRCLTVWFTFILKVQRDTLWSSWSHSKPQLMVLFHCIASAQLQMLCKEPGTWSCFGITSVEVPHKPRRYQKVTWTHCRLLIGHREASLSQPEIVPSISAETKSVTLLPHTKKQERHSFDTHHRSVVCWQAHSSWHHYDNQLWKAKNLVPEASRVEAAWSDTMWWKNTLSWSNAKWHSNSLGVFTKFNCFSQMLLMFVVHCLTATCSNAPKCSNCLTM